MPTVTILDILKRLPKTNCRECGLPTCMAFAATVLKEPRSIDRCPHATEDLEAVREKIPANLVQSPQALRDELLEKLKKDIGRLDFDARAKKLGAARAGEHLVLRCLGKQFYLDRKGNLHSTCHVNNWVHLPILNYAAQAQGLDPTGAWVRFQDLQNASDWTRFFSHRCEKGLQEMLESDPDLLFDTLDLFAAFHPKALQGEAFEKADYLAVLKPLPKVPILIACWKAEDLFAPTLSLLFDRSAEVNLGAQAIYLLTMGLIEMFRRIITRHGDK